MTYLTKSELETCIYAIKELDDGWYAAGNQKVLEKLKIMMGEAE